MDSLARMGPCFIAVSLIASILASCAVIETPNASSAASPSAGHDVILDPNRPVIYWAGSEGDDLKFINSSTGEVIDSIVVGPGPSCICISRDSSVLYVPIPSYMCILTVNTSTHSIVENHSLPFHPLSVGLDGKGFMYVSGCGDETGRIYSIDIRTTWKVKTSEPMTYVGNHVVEVSPDGSTLLAFLLETNPHKIFRYSVNAGVFTYQDADNHDLGASLLNEVVDWARGKIYSTCGWPYGIEIVSISTLDYITTYQTGAYPSCMAMSNDGKYLYCVQNLGGYGGYIWMFNASDGTVMGIMPFYPEIDHLVVAHDLKSAYVGTPIQRIALVPSVTHLYPEPGSLLGYTPNFFAISMQGGLPPGYVQGTTIEVNGSPLETYQYDMMGSVVYLKANKTEVLADGIHTFSVQVPWLDSTIWENTTFTIDRDSPSAIKPALFPHSPYNPSVVLNDSTVVVSAYIVYPNYNLSVEGVIETGWITLDGQNLTTQFEFDRLTIIYNASLDLGTHNVSAAISWDGGLGLAWANWSFVVMDGPLLIPTYPARDQVLTQLPTYIEVAIEERDAGNISAPQIYVDEDPITTSFTDNSSMKAQISWILATGHHTARASLDWDAGKITIDWSFEVDVFVGPREELMVSHQYKEEFSLLVPEGLYWSLEEDSDIGGEVFEVVISGPTFSGFMTNIIITSQRGSGVMETEEYLNDQLDDAIDELEQSGIGVDLIGSRQLRQVDNHSALAALIQLEGYSVYQKILMVASEQHETVWMIIFSIEMGQYGEYNPMFEVMIESFHIEMHTPTPADRPVQALIGLGIAAVAGGGAGAIVWLAKRKRVPQSPK